MKYTKMASAISFVLSVSLSGSLHADDNVMVITANKTEQDITDTLAVVEVITRADIERLQPQSITALFETVAGLDVTHNGGHGQTMSIFTRGANSDHTLFLVDGIRVGSATLGYKELSSIPVDLIDRIEIVKGPRAALWGSDAIAGVIQIFTRRLASGEFQLAGTVGSNDAKHINGAVGFGSEKITNTFAISSEYSEGYDVLEGGNDDDDGYRKVSASLRGDYQLSDDLLLDWVAQVEEGNKEYDTTWAGSPEEGDYKNQLWNIRYRYNLDTWYSELSVKGSRDQTMQYGGSVSKDSASIFETRRQQINGLIQKQVTDAFSVTGGLEWLNDDVGNTTTQYAAEERETKSFFTNLQYKNDTFLTDLALRQDDIESIKNVFTYNASFGLRFGQNNIIAFNRGKGFKAPTFNDLYYPFGGNPDLKSEESVNNELNIKIFEQNHSLVFSIFDSEITNLIDWIPDSNGIWAPQNVNSVDIKGSELTVKVNGDLLSQTFSASYVDAQDKATGSQLDRRAKKSASYELSASYDAFSWFTQVKFTDSRMDRGTRLKSFFALNLGLAFDINQNWKIRFNANDITDESGVTANGYHATGSEYYLGFSYRH